MSGNLFTQSKSPQIQIKHLVSPSLRIKTASSTIDNKNLFSQLKTQQSSSRQIHTSQNAVRGSGAINSDPYQMTSKNDDFFEKE